AALAIPLRAVSVQEKIAEAHLRRRPGEGLRCWSGRGIRFRNRAYSNRVTCSGDERVGLSEEVEAGCVGVGRCHYSVTRVEERYDCASYTVRGVENVAQNRVDDTGGLEVR